MASDQTQGKGPRLWAALALTLALGFVGAMAWLKLSASSGDAFAECRGGQVGGGAIGGPFTLVDEAGRTVTDKDVITGPTLIYFGFTYCPDVCPLDTARNAEAVDILEEMGIEATPVMISFDPTRDTPEVLADFTDNMHPRMVGLTGSEDQVRAAMQAYKVYAKLRDPSEEYYVYDHSTFTYLMLPDTGFADFFKRDETADAMAARVACFVHAAGS